MQQEPMGAQEGAVRDAREGAWAQSSAAHTTAVFPPRTGPQLPAGGLFPKCSVPGETGWGERLPPKNPRLRACWGLP